MSWTTKQKRLMHAAVRAAGLDDDQRRVLLRQLPNAFFDARGRAVAEPTSTSLRLTNADLERFLAWVEQWIGGDLDLRAYPEQGHWGAASAQGLSRMRHRVMAIDRQMRADPSGLWHERSLSGWIRSRVKEASHGDLQRLDDRQLMDLIRGLSAFARRCGLKVPA